MVVNYCDTDPTFSRRAGLHRFVWPYFAGLLPESDGTSNDCAAWISRDVGEKGQ